jgi:hypothetical protein
MTLADSYTYGFNNGTAAGVYCEAGDMDRRESGCECEASSECKDCLTKAAYRAEQNARQYSPFDVFELTVNKSFSFWRKRVWSEYERGISDGIKSGLKMRSSERERGSSVVIQWPGERHAFPSGTRHTFPPRRRYR